MTVESALDRAVFFDTADFGVSVIWARHGEVRGPFVAIFDRPSVSVDGLAEAAMIDREASLLLPETSLPEGAAVDDPVEVEGEPTGFVCRALRPDGTGMVVVDLKRTKLDAGGYHYVDGESPSELFAAFAALRALVTEGLWPE